MKNFIEVYWRNSVLAINIDTIESITVDDKGKTKINTTTSTFYIDECYESICEKIRNAQR